MTECSISYMASEMGKLGKGRKKRLTPEERARRVKAMEWARKFRNRKDSHESKKSGVDC